MHTRVTEKSILFFWLFLLLVGPLQAQVVWENPKFEIYDFLSRQAQKGRIEVADFIQPLSRKEIARHLSIMAASSHQLSAIEDKELRF